MTLKARITNAVDVSGIHCDDCGRTWWYSHG